jgi:nucleoside-diphosphate-sugar epimerase
MSSNLISVYGGFGFVLGEFIRQFPDKVIRIPKQEIVPTTPIILYGVSTVSNYNIFDSATLDIETNLLHLMDTLDACQKTFGNKFEFNFISSWFVYGKVLSSLENPLTEENYCNPTGFYSITKRCAEQLLISYCETFDIKYRILRLANVLGVRDSKASDTKNATQWLLDKIVHNEGVELYEGGEVWRDFIDVRDCAKAMKLVLESGDYNGVYNISNGKSSLMKDIMEYAIKYSGSTSTLWENQHKPNFHSVVQTKDVFIDNQKLKSLGYCPDYTIQQTVESIVDFYKGR